MITNFKQQRIMKPIYNVWILLFCLTFSSCYDEDIIDPTPDPLALAGGIEFPQGDNPWDNDALEIYKNILKEDPDNQNAIDAVRRLSGFRSKHKDLNTQMLDFFINMKSDEEINEFKRWLIKI